MNHRKLIVISLDSLGYLDLKNNIDQVPNLKQLIRFGSWVQQVKGIYPTLTYPTHTSIITGQYPDTHGVVNNTRMQPERERQDWYWYRKYIKVPTLYDLANQAKMTTAAFLWPVTAKAKINYNISEIFANRIWKSQTLVSIFNSTPNLLLNLYHKYGKLLHGIKQPWLDNFTTACAVDTLKNKKPDLTLIHLVDMDDRRHQYGVNSKEAKEAFKRLDQHVGQIIKATQKANTYYQTDFAIVGDHYQIDVNHVIHLNMYFAQKGLLKPINGKHTYQNNWQMASQSADGSCYVYTRKNISPSEKTIIKREIKQIEGVERIYEGKQIQALGADHQCLFLIEAKPGYYFDNLVNFSQLVESEDKIKGNHGFDPNEPNYSTTAIFFGPGISSAYQIKSAHIVDEAPTLAALLGLKFSKPIAGKLIQGIIKN